jgi:ABC-type Fe3+ transport system substrate-binding protein
MTRMGTLFIPNTLCIIRGGPNPENARRLLDYLLTPEIEIRLAREASAQLHTSRSMVTAASHSRAGDAPRRAALLHGAPRTFDGFSARDALSCVA